MSEIFKAYDIRGVVPDNLNAEKIYKIGKAYADMMKEELDKDEITLIVGRDMRITGEEFKKSIIKGITEQGVNVIDIDLASTPTFYFAVSMLGADGGMQVSASHNPKEYNGVKIVKSKAYPVGFDTGINEIKRRVEADEFKECDKIGNMTKNNRILDKVLDYSINFIGKDKIKPLKVVVDVANAMSSLDLEKLFGSIPCELVKMNFELDGTFPAHEADPFKEKNITELKKKVIEENADLGIATDGDGDRIFFVDDKGELVDPAIIRGILAKYVLKRNPGATICYDIRPGKITYDMIVENGGKPSVTKVGHSLIKAQGIKEDAPFSGESSGHFFFKTDYGFFEAPMIAALIILEEISESGKSFSEIVQPLKRYYHSGEINSEVDDKEGKIKEIAEKYNDTKEISWLDGITIFYDDFWFNVRPSNTESKLRLNLEAKSKEIMEEKRDEVLGLIRG